MPELPEMQALAERLDAVLAGAALQAADLLQFSSLKTVEPAPEAVVGRTLQGVGRRGKHLRGRYRPAELPNPTRVPSEAFGGLMRAYRRTTGQSLGAFADAHGLSVLYLSDVERGLQAPSPRLRAIYSAGIMRDCK